MPETPDGEDLFDWSMGPGGDADVIQRRLGPRRACQIHHWSQRFEQALRHTEPMVACSSLE